MSHGLATVAVYTVSWTVDAPAHQPTIDLIIGPWGESSDPKDRILVSLLYEPGDDGGDFGVIDAATRPAANDASLCGHAMGRDDVIGTPLAPRVFELIDAIWAGDPRIEGVE